MRIYLREDCDESDFYIYNGHVLAGYYGDKNATTMAIPERVTYLETDALAWNCGNIKHIQLPSHLDAIGDNAMQGCTALEEITLPKSVTTLYWDAFAYCKSLKKVVILSEHLEVGRNMFYRCPDDIEILYRGMPLSVEDFNRAFEVADPQESNYELLLDIEKVVAQYNKRNARRLQDEQDIANGIKSDSMIEDENDWGF